MTETLFFKKKEDLVSAMRLLLLYRARLCYDSLFPPRPAPFRPYHPTLNIQRKRVTLGGADTGVCTHIHTRTRKKEKKRGEGDRRHAHSGDKDTSLSVSTPFRLRKRHGKRAVVLLAPLLLFPSVSLSPLIVYAPDARTHAKKKSFTQKAAFLDDWYHRCWFQRGNQSSQLRALVSIDK